MAQCRRLRAAPTLPSPACGGGQEGDHDHAHHSPPGGKGGAITTITTTACTTVTSRRSASCATQPIAREALRLLLDALQQNLGPNLLRVKGIVHVAEDPDRPAVIQGAQHLLHNLSWLDRWPDADRRSRIVFITQGFDRAEVEDMIAVLDRVAARTAAARARAQAEVADERTRGAHCATLLGILPDFTAIPARVEHVPFTASSTTGGP